MTDHSPAERVLSGFLRVVLDQQFSKQERLSAAAALRSGEIVECVLKYLDYTTASPILSDDLTDKAVNTYKDSNKSLRSERRMDNPTVNQVFDLTRKRKISRSDVLGFISRLEPAIFAELENLSLRQALTLFRSSTSDVQWLTLFKIITGDIDEDPYVSSILRHR